MLNNASIILHGSECSRQCDKTRNIYKRTTTKKKTKLFFFVDNCLLESPKEASEKVLDIRRVL